MKSPWFIHRYVGHTSPLLFVASLLAACGSTGSATEKAAATRDVAIEFAAQAGGQPVRCGQPLSALGKTSATADLRDLRFYISAVALIDAAGRTVPVQLARSDWQTDGVTLIDLADGNGPCVSNSPLTNTRLVGQVPVGEYRGLRFTVGVPHAQNHSDYATAVRPLDVQAMAWSWQAGRKFMQVELQPAGGVARPAGNAAPGRAFLFHLGAAGCKGNPVSGETVACERPNRMDVRLEDFDAARERVVLDLGALYAGSDVRRDGGGALGCMSAHTDPECRPLFQALGMDLASGRSLDAGARQSVFRAAPR